MIESPSVYRTGEQVIADWIAYFEQLHPGEKPSIKWLVAKTGLAKSYVSTCRAKYYSAQRNFASQAYSSVKDSV